MAETMVYGCDWCKEIIPKDNNGKPKYAATVDVTDHYSHSMPDRKVTEQICATCRQALRALQAGRYRR